MFRQVFTKCSNASQPRESAGTRLRLQKLEERLVPASWTQVSTAAPIVYTVDSSGDVFASFANKGTYELPSGGSWTQISKSIATVMTTDSNGNLYAGFSAGVYEYSNGSWSGWSGSPTQAPTAIIVTSDASTVYAAFSGNGIWALPVGGTATQITKGAAGEIAVDSNNNLYANFSAGLYEYNGSWNVLTKSDPSQFVLDSNANIYAIFAGNGVWEDSGGSWSQLTPNTTATKIAVDSSGDLFVGFSNAGLYVLPSGGSWTQISSQNPTAIAIDSSSDVFVTFSAGGTWEYPSGSSGTEISKGTATMISNYNSVFYAVFGSSGLWDYQ
jgi:hypothetical protein